MCVKVATEGLIFSCYFVYHEHLNSHQEFYIIMNMPI